MGFTLQERINSPLEKERILADKIAAGIRVATVGIINSFDPASQTATVKPAIREGIRNKLTGIVEDVEIPLLLDVPVVFPRAGGFCITLPVTAGDECLVVFLDSCMDAWWSSGGIQNQAERRRHDLSDAVAIVGITSQPRRVNGYSGSGITIRAENGTAKAVIEKDAISLSADNISISANKTISISAPNSPDGNVSIVGWTASLTQLKP